MKRHTICISMLLLCCCGCLVFGQTNNIFSTSFEITPIKTLNSELRFPVIIGEGETIFLNSLSYLQILEENIYYGFADENKNTEESIYSFAYNLEWLQQLADHCMLVIGVGAEIAASYETELDTSGFFVNTVTGILFFTGNNDYWGFGLTYTIGDPFPIPYFNFKFTVTDTVCLYGIVPEYLIIAFTPIDKLELALKAEMVSFRYAGNHEKYTAETPRISLTTVWCGARITVNLFEYLFLGIEGGYSLYRSAGLLYADDMQSSDLENALVLKCFLNIGLK